MAALAAIIATWSAMNVSGTAAARRGLPLGLSTAVPFMAAVMATIATWSAMNVWGTAAARRGLPVGR